MFDRPKLSVISMFDLSEQPPASHQNTTRRKSKNSSRVCCCKASPRGPHAGVTEKSTAYFPIKYSRLAAVRRLFIAAFFLYLLQISNWMILILHSCDYLQLDRCRLFWAPTRLFRLSLKRISASCLASECRELEYGCSGCLHRMQKVSYKLLMKIDVGLCLLSKTLITFVGALLLP